MKKVAGLVLNPTTALIQRSSEYISYLPCYKDLRVERHILHSCDLTQLIFFCLTKHILN